MHNITNRSNACGLFVALSQFLVDKGQALAVATREDNSSLGWVSEIDFTLNIPEESPVTFKVLPTSISADERLYLETCVNYYHNGEFNAHMDGLLYKTRAKYLFATVRNKNLVYIFETNALIQHLDDRKRDRSRLFSRRQWSDSKPAADMPNTTRCLSGEVVFLEELNKSVVMRDHYWRLGYKNYSYHDKTAFFWDSTPKFEEVEGVNA